MRDFSEAADDFESWISQSKKHRFIAEMCWAEFLNLIDRKPSHSDDSLRQVAMLEGTMMHQGFSIENAAKGVIVARSSTIIIGNRINSSAWEAKGTGHEISAIIRSIDESLYLAAGDLLDRAQEFVIWAGRYPTPMKRESYEAAINAKRLSMKSTDTQAFETLHDALTKLALQLASDKPFNRVAEKNTGGQPLNMENE